MHPTTQRIVDALHDPGGLETLYRQDPASFQAAFPEASRTAPDSPIVQVWAARLDYREPARELAGPRLWPAIGLGLLVGLLVRVPAVWFGDEWYYPRLAPSLVILSLAAHFWLEHRDKPRLIAGLALGALIAAWASYLPGETDSVMMALIHLPILCWVFLGFVFAGPSWRDAEPRIRFLRYNGELLVLGTLVALGGMVFSGITVALFQLVNKHAAQWYVENIGVVGAAAVPLAATYLYDVVFRRRTGIASVLARVFAPLFLVMTATYLVVAFVGGRNPFVDREFLITFNGLLLVVLGMTAFSIAERGEQAEVGWVDWVNVALVVVTLIIDVIALSAILFRLASWGFTPNRVVVLGANLVIMAHLAWTCLASIRQIRGKSGPDAVRRAVTGYLPVYAGWAALVAFGLPLVFRFS